MRIDVPVLAAPEQRDRRRALVALCASQITSWGVLYYAFPVLAPRVSASTGWSLPVVMAAFSAGQLVAAGVGIPVGRRLDEHGPRGVMTAGSLLAVPSLLIVATAQNPAWFVAGWLLAGASMGAVLYPPAFAALTRWYGARRVAALTALTLTAGLASTVFAPVTAALTAVLDWRGSYLVLAAVLLVVTVPAHWWGLRLAWPERPDDATDDAADPADTARSRGFVALTAALSVAAFAAVAAVVNLIPLLTERGVSAGTAAVALGLGGAGQVVGRVFYPALARRTGVRTRTLLTLVGVAVTTALLGVLAAMTTLVAAAVVAGVARGLFTLVQATAVTDRWGARHYGRLTGLLSAPLTIATALAPWAGAALAEVLGSYSAMYLLLAALALVAAALGMAATPHSAHPTTIRRTA